MTWVLGLSLSEARKRLEAAGYTVFCVETRSRKGSGGNALRVLRAIERAPGKVELLYSAFKTDLFWTAKTQEDEEGDRA